MCAVLIVKVETNSADITAVSLKMAYYVRPKHVREVAKNQIIQYNNLVDSLCM